MALRRRKRRNWRQIAVNAAAALIAIGLALPFVIPLKPWFPNLEAQLSAAVGEPVRFNSLRAGLLPRPHLEADSITIGRSGEITVAHARLYPELPTLREPTQFFKSIEADEVSASRNAVLQFLGEHSREGGLQAIRLGHIRATHVKLGVFDGKLGDLELDATVDRDNQLLNLVLAGSDQRSRLEVTPANGTTQVTFSAQDWKPLAGPQIPFERVFLQGVLTRDALAVSEFTAGVYGGDIRGGMEINWANGWSVTGRARVTRLNLYPMMQVLQTDLPVHGTFESELRFTGAAASPGQLLDSMKFDGKFNIVNGVLDEIDFSRVIQGAGRNGVRGGQTQFDQFSGSLQTGNGYRFSGLRLTHGMLAVTGAINVAPGEQLSGSMNVELKSTVGILGSAVQMGGALGEPVLMPSAR
jgi:uncharacterized protein involved in outer membrane biogenesis